jgi:hypothetical protein
MQTSGYNPARPHPPAQIGDGVRDSMVSSRLGGRPWSEPDNIFHLRKEGPVASLLILPAGVEREPNIHIDVSTRERWDASFALFMTDGVRESCCVNS